MDQMYREKTVRTEAIFTGKILSLRVDTIELGEGKTATREIIEHGGAVCIVAINDRGKVLFVKQFRKPIEKYLLEIPAGRLEEGEDPEVAAVREARHGRERERVVQQVGAALVPAPIHRTEHR